MDRYLSILSNQEIMQLEDAFAYITILIAGADGKIDAHELSYAEKIAQIRTYAGDERLKSFHAEVNVSLHSRIQELLGELPNDTPARSSIISDKLSQLNHILSALDPSIGSYLYKGYISFATRVAKSSGGFLSFFSIGSAERKWVSLPMLNPILYDPDEEE